MQRRNPLLPRPSSDWLPWAAINLQQETQRVSPGPTCPEGDVIFSFPADETGNSSTPPTALGAINRASDPVRDQ